MSKGWGQGSKGQERYVWVSAKGPDKAQKSDIRNQRDGIRGQKGGGESAKDLNKA